MTVKELIAKLAEFPQDAVVCVPVAYGDTDPFEVASVGFETMTFRGSARARMGEKVVVISS